MFVPVNLSERVFYVGVNDRRTHLFENLWPLERGVAYNSYVIKDEKVALIDSVEIGQVDKFLKKVRAVIGDRPVDYLVINHMEPDHAGAVDRKSTRLNSSHVRISYAVFCLKKK